jgi:hypothetical protein
VRLKHEEYLHVHNTSHATASTETTIKEIPEVFSLLKISFRVTVYEAPVGALEGENVR